MNKKYNPFKRAVPVFAKGLSEEMHINCGFLGKIDNKGQKTEIKMAGSSFYQLFINGEFVHYGPCRCGHGVYRVDEFDITDRLRKGTNYIAVLSVGYNINSFFSLDQPSFLQCEIFADGKSILATLPTDAPHRGAFKSFLLDARVRKTQKYSFQRAFTEVYDLYPEVDGWKIGEFEKAKPCELEFVGKKELTERVLPYNILTKAVPVTILYEGNVSLLDKVENRWADRSLTQISPILKGFKDEELDVHLSDEMQRITSVNKNYIGCSNHGFDIFEPMQVRAYEFANEKTGFIGIDIDCLTDEGEFYILFDEVLNSDREINPLAKDFCNGLKISCKKGVYHFNSFECYGMKYMKIAVTKGKMVLSNFRIIEYVSPCEITYEYKGTNEAHKRIIDAAIETFKQNSADLFMDCPTRERAGWLCDSFFTARSEKLFTGKNITEYVFLQNFLLAKEFKCIPKGMLPMCYPADQYDGVFIPNWAMWFVIQLEDALKRGQNPELIYSAKKRVYELLEYFTKFENELGLLENLESWIFIEWSKANDLVRDLNYPTNMCYAAVLRAAGKMYNDQKLLKKAEKIIKVIKKRSYNGKYFRDRELRVDGKLQITEETSETCQYYAFFFDIIKPEEYPELWNELLTDFGPERKQTGLHPDVFFANSFVGNYMRLDILAKYGKIHQLSKEIEGYFDFMAKRTGTLWENDSECASCNHGFASYAGYFIDCVREKKI